MADQSDFEVPVEDLKCASTVIPPILERVRDYF